MSTPADELRAAAAKLKPSPGRVVAVIESREDENGEPIPATRYVIAVCSASHTGKHLDQDACCDECRFLHTYNDPELAALVAALLAIPKPLAAWLKEEARRWNAVRTAGATRPCDEGLALARAILGNQP